MWKTFHYAPLVCRCIAKANDFSGRTDVSGLFWPKTGRFEQEIAHLLTMTYPPKSPLKQNPDR